MARTTAGDILLKLLDELAELRRENQDTGTSLKKTQANVEEIQATLQEMQGNLHQMHVSARRSDGHLARMGRLIKTMVDYLTDHEARIAELEKTAG